MKKILKSSAIGIGFALIIFTIVGIVFDYHFQGTFLLENYSFTKMAVGSILVGIGFGAPSAVYENDALPYLLQVVLHLGIGFAVLMIVSYTVGWIPSEMGIWGIIGYIAADMAGVLLIWFGFYRHYQKEAAEFNKKIEERAKAD